MHQVKTFQIGDWCPIFSLRLRLLNPARHPAGVFTNCSKFYIAWNLAHRPASEMPGNGHVQNSCISVVFGVGVCRPEALSVRRSFSRCWSRSWRSWRSFSCCWSRSWRSWRSFSRSWSAVDRKKSALSGCPSLSAASTLDSASLISEATSASLVSSSSMAMTLEHCCCSGVKTLFCISNPTKIRASGKQKSHGGFSEVWGLYARKLIAASLDSQLDSTGPAQGPVPVRQKHAPKFWYTERHIPVSIPGKSPVTRHLGALGHRG